MLSLVWSLVGLVECLQTPELILRINKISHRISDARHTAPLKCTTTTAAMVIGLTKLLGCPAENTPGHGAEEGQEGLATVYRWPIKRTVGSFEEVEMAATAHLTLVAPDNEKFTVP